MVTPTRVRPGDLVRVTGPTAIWRWRSIGPGYSKIADVPVGDVYLVLDAFGDDMAKMRVLHPQHGAVDMNCFDIEVIQRNSPPCNRRPAVV